MGDKHHKDYYISKLAPRSCAHTVSICTFYLPLFKPSCVCLLVSLLLVSCIFAHCSCCALAAVSLPVSQQLQLKIIWWKKMEPVAPPGDMSDVFLHPGRLAFTALRWCWNQAHAKVPSDWWIHGLRPAAEVSAVLRLDARVVGQTRWAPSSRLSWDQTFCLQLERVSKAGWMCFITMQKHCR